jgi:hypothetical protein
MRSGEPWEEAGWGLFVCATPVRNRIVRRARDRGGEVLRAAVRSEGRWWKGSSVFRSIRRRVPRDIRTRRREPLPCELPDKVHHLAPGVEGGPQAFEHRPELLVGMLIGLALGVTPLPGQVNALESAHADRFEA